MSALAAAPFVHARSQEYRLAGPEMEVVDPQVTPSFWVMPRWVWLRRPVTGEQVRLVYWRDGQLLQGPYEQISWLLRDVRFENMLKTGDLHIRSALATGRIGREHLSPWVLMDPVIIDVLYAYSAWLHAFGVRKPLDLTSGFRHLITNDLTEGAVRGSEHTKGRAADAMVSGVDVTALASFGRWLQGGGVGLYQSRAFLHLDSGRVRSWSG